MLFRAVFATIAAATLALTAAVPEPAEVAPFNPTANPLPTPVYEEIEQPMTNAERLRRGMAPLPPRMKRFGMHAPGPARPVPPEASPAPPQPSSEPNVDVIIHEGIVQVADAESGKVLGYVSNKLSRHGQLGVDKNYKHPLKVMFKTPRADAKPGNIEITNGDSRAGKFFGAVVSEWTRGAKLGKGKNVFAYLTRTGETKSGLGPMSVKNALRAYLGLKLKAQSSLWTANQWTGELAATWTNTGSEVLESTIFYHKKSKALALSADPEKFQEAHKDAVRVKLSIIPEPLY